MTIAEALTETAQRLRAAHIEPAWREARLLVRMALNATPEVMAGYPERPLDSATEAELAHLVERRCAGEPISRISGVREFWSLTFTLSPDTLDPRPDSETVLDAVLASILDLHAPLRLLDLGVGSGCLLIALLRELPNAWGVGIDISEGACRTARTNAARLEVADRCAFLVADWADALEGRFDVVISNPPYIADAEIDSLPREVVQFDPRRALAGGSDGLEAYRRLAGRLPSLLPLGGLAVLEIGAGQAEAVTAILAKGGLPASHSRRDLAGVTRCIVARKGSESWRTGEKRVSNEVLSD